LQRDVARRDDREEAVELASDQVLEAAGGDRVVVREVGLERVQRAGRERQADLEAEAGRNNAGHPELAEYAVRGNRVIDPRPRVPVHRADSRLDAEDRGLVRVTRQAGW
jgi:hypothetical protein